MITGDDCASLAQEFSSRNGGSESVWTIDLLYLLQERHKGSHRKPRYYTKCLDVPLSHGSHSYYAATFHRDRERVLPLLKHSDAFEEEISTEELVRRVSEQGCVALVLVDKGTLNQTAAARKDYLGHYVLVVAADSAAVQYLDPDSDGSMRSVATSILNSAREVDGTDKDVIFL